MSATINHDVKGTMAILEDEVAEQFIADWEDLVNNEEDLTSIFECDGKNLYGYKTSFETYTCFIGAPGVVTYKVRYAYDAGASGFKFKFVIFGVDNTGERITAYFSPETPITTPVMLNVLGDGYTAVVSQQLAETWLANWDNTEVKSSDYFKVTIYQQHDEPSSYQDVLRGYNFSAEDFTQVLETEGHVIKDVGVLCVLHDFFPPGGTTVERIFGNLLASFDVDHQVISNFYDLSSPCPNTC